MHEVVIAGGGPTGASPGTRHLVRSGLTTATWVNLATWGVVAHTNVAAAAVTTKRAGSRRRPARLRGG